VASAHGCTAGAPQQSRWAHRPPGRPHRASSDGAARDLGGGCPVATPPENAPNREWDSTAPALTSSRGDTG